MAYGYGRNSNSGGSGKRYTLAQKVAYYKKKATGNGSVNFNSRFTLEQQLEYYKSQVVTSRFTTYSPKPKLFGRRSYGGSPYGRGRSNY